MKAELLTDTRVKVSDRSFAEIVVWKLPRTLPGSAHNLKYRLAFVANGRCALRYDNEAGKGDHRHAGSRQYDYRFETLEKLIEDFWSDISAWRREHEDT